jgi:hypothetical protein
MDTLNVSDYPEYQAAAQKLSEFQVRLTTLERAMERTAEAVNGGRSIGEQADALLRGVAPDDFFRADGLRRDYEVARRERNVLRVAVERQRVEVNKRYLAACVAIRTQFRPAHEAIAKRMAKAMLAFSAALDEEIAFRDEVRAAGIDFGWPLLPIVPFMGQYALSDTPEELQDYLAGWFKELRTGSASTGSGVAYDIGKGP